MAFHPLSKALALPTVDCTVAQGHPHNWSEGEHVKKRNCYSQDTERRNRSLH